MGKRKSQKLIHVVRRRMLAFLNGRGISHSYCPKSRVLFEKCERELGFDSPHKQTKAERINRLLAALPDCDPKLTRGAKKATRTEPRAKYAYDHPVVAAFYASGDWARLRYDIIKRDGLICACCKATPEDGFRMNVDHIKPLRFFWNLRLDPNNLQVLCSLCNHGKGNRDHTDWRVA